MSVTYFDFAALVVTAVLIICFYYKKNVPNTQNRIFLMLLWFVFAATLFDILDVAGTYYPHKFPMWYQLSTSYGFFIALNTIPVIYVHYIFVLTNTQKKLLKTRAGIFLIIPISVSYMAIATNSLTGWIFYFNENMEYFRGSAQLILYAVSFYYLAFGIIHVMRYKGVIPLNKRIALYSFAFLAFGPIIVQFFVPELMIGMFGICICMLLIYMTIQNPEELLDYPTGLFNRSTYVKQASLNFASQISFCTISLRINDYAYFRRVFGVTQMAKVTKEISEELERFPLKNKRVYYMGDGHFNFVVDSEDMYEGLPYELSSLFDRTFGAGMLELDLTAQLCVIHSPEDADSIEALMDFVDFTIDRMIHGNAVLFTAQIASNDKKRQDKIACAVQNALLNDGFEVYYQPIYSTVNGNFHSAEALIRLTDAELGRIPPDEFIPITEKNGDIIKVGMMVFSKVCAFIAENDLKGLGIDYIEVNLSVAQCMQKKLAEELLGEMEKHKLSTEYINLEITETAAAYSPEMLAGNMKVLAASGIKFSLDDYGTGFSSMSCMVELPFDFVKLDREIISAMDNEKAFIAMNSTVAMLKQLNMRIVAEGVETLEQVRVLTDMGCDYLQGFYFSKPIPEEEFLTFLAVNRNKGN